MSGLADMLAKASDDKGEPSDGGGAGALEQAVKAFFEAGKKGDYAEAASCLRDAVSLADSDEDEGGDMGGGDGDDGGEHHALLLMPRGKERGY